MQSSFDLFFALFFFSILIGANYSFKVHESRSCRCFKHSVRDINPISGRIFNSYKVEKFEMFPFVGSIYNEDIQNKGRSSIFEFQYRMIF